MSDIHDNKGNNNSWHKISQNVNRNHFNDFRGVRATSVKHTDQSKTEIKTEKNPQKQVGHSDC